MTYTDDVNTYLAQNVFDFDHHLDVDALRVAFAAMLSRHDNLRAGFASDDLPRPVQYIGRNVSTAVDLVDLSALTEAAATEHLAEAMRSDSEAPFDLRVPPLVRLTVIRLPDRGDRLLLTCHFLLWDGWSRELVLRELFAPVQLRWTARRTARRHRHLCRLPALGGRPGPAMPRRSASDGRAERTGRTHPRGGTGDRR